MNPTVGRIVHFYDETLAQQRHHPRQGGVDLNGVGAGPYPALVLQVFDDGHSLNLLVHGWGGDWREGSVASGHTNSQRYWTWPPRVE